MQTRRTPKKLDEDGLWNYALRILGQRSYSSAELKRKLSIRANAPASVATVVNKLREYGLADDAKFSQTFASARLNNQRFGRMRVLRDLSAKRVARPVAEKAIQETFAGVDETDLARRFLERRYRGKKLSDLFQEEKQLASAYRRLRTAGFSGSTSIAALKSYSKRAEELEDPPEDE